MNLWQVSRQLQYLIRNRSWTGSSTTVFASQSVRVTGGPLEELVEQGFVMPVALIRPLGAVADPEYQEEPDLLEQEIAVTLGVSIPNDDAGEAHLIGAQREGQTDSRGRGLLEIEEELFAAVELLNTDDGVVIQHRMSSIPEPRPFSENYCLIRDYLFLAHVTADRFYHPPINVREC